MSCSQVKPVGNRALKKLVQVVKAAGVESDSGTNGNPTLQLGGEQDAVTEPEPGDGVESVQDCKHVLVGVTTPGLLPLQVKGIFVSTTPLFVLGRDMLPMMSVTTAVAFCDVPLEVAKLVWLVC
jgi:hypothetical protein